MPSIIEFTNDGPSQNPSPRPSPGSGGATIFDRLPGIQPYMSYSGSDIIATITLPDGETIVLGELQTISYSIHRENTPVRLLGHSAPVSFVKGSRTIAGSMIFTVFDRYAFYRIEKLKDRVHQGIWSLADQLPPFDITINFMNEYGHFSKMKLLGLSIVDEGGTMSIDDLITEQTFTYIARGIQPMISYKPNTVAENVPARSIENIQTVRDSSSAATIILA